MNDLVAKINKFICEREWFDFTLTNYSASELTITGSINLEYYQEIEISLKDVFYISCGTGWKSDTSAEVLTILQGKEAYDFNVKNNIQQGYTIFEFHTEDFDNNFYIAAQSITCDFKKKMNQ